jgi:anti-sigma B factor antagonist
MRVSFEDRQGRRYCLLEGEIDMNSSPILRKELDTLISQKVQELVISFKDVSYIDSSALATLIEAFQKMRRYGGKLILTSLSKNVRSVFEVSRLDSIFTIE